MVKPTVSVVLLVLAGQARGAAVEQGPCAGEVLPIQVKVGVEAAPICVAAGTTAVVDFESAIVEGRTVVEGGDVKPYTGDDGRSVALVASPGAAVGAVRRVTIYFADGLEPASATFPLVVVSEGTQRQVKVVRQARTAASLREEVEDLTRRLAQCESRGLTPTAGGPAGVLPEFLSQGDKAVERLKWNWPSTYVVRPGFEGAVDGLRTVLHVGGSGRPEAAVEVRVKNRASESWEVEEATLVSSSGEALARVRTLTRVVVAPSDVAAFYIVSEPTGRAVPGAYTLKLRGGGRELVLENVTFK